MTTSSKSGDWEAVETALVRYFLARESSEEVDVLTVCGGDEGLAARVNDAISKAPDLIVGSDAEVDDLPESFGEFDIVKRIGRGGMGTVYLAKQRSLGREVALKLLDRTASTMPSARLRMRREAELTAHLNHPNIVPLYAVGEVGNVPYIAMKYLVGPSLAEVERPWPPEQVGQLGIALAEALDYAHLQGIVHRDLKPANVILEGDQPIIVDFGLARAQSDPTLTQEGKVAGTLRYMAPERLDTSTAVLDPRVDIYGLGATLYELLAGNEVFSDKSATALVRSVLVRDPAPLHLRGRHHDLETIILRSLAKEPSRRFQTSAEMAADLKRYVAGEPVTSHRLSRAARLARLVRRYPRASALLTAALLIAGLAIAVSVTQSTYAWKDRERRLAAARFDLGEHRYQRAFDSLELLAQRHPKDVEVNAWFSRARAELAIDRLLVVAADHGVNVAPEDVKDLSTYSLSDTIGARRAAIAKLAAVVALGQGGDRAAARIRSQQLPTAFHERRAARAVDAWLAEAPLPWSLPPVANNIDPDETMLTALVMRLAGAMPRTVLEELHTVDVARQNSRRSLLLEAIVRTDLGHSVVAANLLRGLARVEATEVVWRWLANAQLRLGQIDAAGVALANAESDQSPPATYLRLLHAYEITVRDSDRDARERLFAALRAKTERSRQEERFLAEYDGKLDIAAVPDVLERLHRLHADETSPYARELLVANQIEIAGWHLPQREDVAGEVSVAELHRQLLDTWREPAAALRHPRAQALANTWIARSLCCSGVSGDLDRGLELFRATCGSSPGLSLLALEYGKAASHLDGINKVIQRTHALAARAAIDDVLQRAETGRLAPLVPGLARELRYYAWMLSWQAQDHVELTRRFPTIEDMVPDTMLEGARAATEWTQGVLAEFRRR